MKQRFTLFRRGDVFYCEDTSRASSSASKPGTKRKPAPCSTPKTNRCRQPLLNLQIARAYLTAADPAMATRTWQRVMDQMQTHGKATTQARCSRAMQAAFYAPIRQLLGGCAGWLCAAEFESPSELLRALAGEPIPEVILMDIHMGPENGIDAIGPVLRVAPDTRVVIMTTFYNAANHHRALASGASGFLLKSGGLEQFLEVMEGALAAKPKTAPVPIGCAASRLPATRESWWERVLGNLFRSTGLRAGGVEGLALKQTLNRD